jgi:hypothetical protein
LTQYAVCLLWCTALHSLATGIGLLLQPTALLTWGGWGRIAEPFFAAQGGVFHVLMSVLYVFAAWRGREQRALLVYIVFVKITAALFLLLYYFLVTPIWLVLVSGVIDGAIGVALLVLTRNTVVRHA